MNTLFNRNTGIAAFAAVVIVGLTGLTMDRGHEGGLRRAVVEVGVPETLSVGNVVIAQLPVVDVVATRETRLADAKSHAEPQG